MQVIKALLAILAVILAGPLIFVAVMAVQAGCLLCLEGDGAGSAAEAWLNVGLVVIILSLVAAASWSRFKGQRANN